MKVGSGALDLHDEADIITGEMVISSSLRNRRRRRGPPPPPAARKVTGTLSPDATGDYSFAGNYNNKSYFKHFTKSWYIWYELKMPGEFHYWRITKQLGVEAGPRWSKLTVVYESEHGDYGPTAPTTGTATVGFPD